MSTYWPQTTQREDLDTAWFTSPGYPAKRALSAMRKHGAGRALLAGYPRSQHIGMAVLGSRSSTTLHSQQDSRGGEHKLQQNWFPSTGNMSREKQPVHIPSSHWFRLHNLICTVWHIDHMEGIKCKTRDYWMVHVTPCYCQYYCQYHSLEHSTQYRIKPFCTNVISKNKF